ncbi:MAG TPA: NUDIX domain-containing protein [Allosphingosinicella sp.]|nr:NUDIX domain-containing protein [Allosphingosinicella sp.]
MDAAPAASYAAGVQPGRFLLRTALTGLQQLRLAWWRLRGSRGRGALAVPLTPEGQLILIRLTYARGWRVPGGGIGRGEGAEAAALRELCEEIGMTGHGPVVCVDRMGASSLFLVRDVVYSPRRTFEVEEVAEFPPDALPAGATSSTRRCVAAALALVRRA